VPFVRSERTDPHAGMGARAKPSTRMRGGRV
jgi:hypothetical protein